MAKIEEGSGQVGLGFAAQMTCRSCAGSPEKTPNAMGKAGSGSVRVRVRSPLTRHYGLGVRETKTGNRLLGRHEAVVRRTLSK